MKHRLAIYLVGFMSCVLGSAIWNHAGYEDMIGRRVGAFIWGPSDFWIATTFGAFLPAQAVAVGSVVLDRSSLNAPGRRHALVASFTGLLAMGVCISHYVFWNQIRSMCCGTTW